MAIAPKIHISVALVSVALKAYVNVVYSLVAAIALNVQRVPANQIKTEMAPIAFLIMAKKQQVTAAFVPLVYHTKMKE